MASPDLPDRGLDPAHILGVCKLAADGLSGQPQLAIITPAGVRVAIRTRQAAGDALTALTLTGYQAIPVASGGRGRALLVTGWSPAGLDARLIAMRAVIGQLDAGPTATASAAISRIRRTPGRSPARQHDDALSWARARLRTWVSDRSGVHAPHNPAIVPADLANALRIRATWVIETRIDDLIDQHLRVAGHALDLFASLRQNAGDDWAQDTAVRRARITFYLSGPASPEPLAQDSSALIQRTGRPQRPARPQPRPDPASRTRGTADGSAAQRGRAPRTAAADVPRAVSAADLAADPAASPPASPGGRHFPARRPGPSP